MPLRVWVGILLFLHPGSHKRDDCRVVVGRLVLLYQMGNRTHKRAVKSVNDEFVRQCVERHWQEQAQNRRGDIEASAAEMPRLIESGDK